MRLSIIVPAYNEDKLLAETLGRINASRRALNEETQLIVVDNASTDRTCEIAESGRSESVDRNGEEHRCD